MVTPIENALYKSRKRVRGQRDLTKALLRTLFLAPSAVVIDTDVTFPNRAQPITIVFTLSINGVTSSGTIINLATIGGGHELTVDLLNGVITVGVGSSGANRVDVSNTVAIPDGDVVQVGVAVLPGAGKVALLFNGKIVAQGTAANNTFPSGEFASATDGALLTSMVNASVVSDFSFYVGQLPSGFTRA